MKARRQINLCWIIRPSSRQQLKIHLSHRPLVGIIHKPCLNTARLAVQFQIFIPEHRPAGGAFFRNGIREDREASSPRLFERSIGLILFRILHEGLLLAVLQHLL